MSAVSELLAALIANWHPDGDLDPDDPLSIQLAVAPHYLPLLQPKTHYCHYGKRVPRVHILGLSPQGDWVEDGPGKGGMSRRYGSARDCFGKAPFAIAP